MIGDKREELPDDLIATAKMISDAGGCKCDISVGFICEPCAVHHLMVSAANEIRRLNKQLQIKTQTNNDHIASLPIADFTGATYVGRNLYRIEGFSGLYHLKRNSETPPTAVAARRRSTRGANWAESIFVRDKDAERSLGLAEVVQK
jgi:hypothetical protein